VQVLVYAAGVDALFRRSGGGRTVTEASYHYLRSPFPDDATTRGSGFPIVTLGGESLRQAREELGRVLAVVLDGIRRGDYPPVPDLPPNDGFGPCAYCEVAAACGSLVELTSRWRRFVSREPPPRLVQLRGGSAAEQGGGGEAS
jgi:hypothetical protein